MDLDDCTQMTWEEFDEEENGLEEEQRESVENGLMSMVEENLENETPLPTEKSFDAVQPFTTNEFFSSREALIGWAKKVGKENGIIIVIKSSESGGPSRKPRVRLACERSGKYRPSKKGEEAIGELKRKSTGSKKCGCPFELLGVKSSNEHWKLKVVCGLHNHAAATQLEGHSYAGRLTEKEKEILKIMSKNHVKPKNILMTLKAEDKKNVTTIKSIYNARQRYRLIEKDGHSQMQQLMKKLGEYNYVEWHRNDGSTDCITDLFWSHPMAIKLLNVFPHVLIMDCTYKSNRYKYSLLEIVGVTSTELTFSVAFAFMDHEYEVNYTWAMEKLRSIMTPNTFPGVVVTNRELGLMNAIHKVFPITTILLCRCHISKNVLANCKKLFDRKEMWEKFMLSWNLIVFASTENEYERRIHDLIVEYYAYKDVLDYVRNTWLNDYKEKFVATWTNKIMHFGNVTTNRVESAHAKLKKHLGLSQCDFESSWTIINSLIESQHIEIKGSFEKSLMLVQHNFKEDIFKELRGVISRSAMNMVLKQSQLVEKIGVDKVACGCVIKMTHGLPCAHEIAEFMMQGRSIPLSVVHPRWTKLHLVNTASDYVSSQLTIDSEIESIYKRFHSEPEACKLVLKQKLRELADPTTISLMPTNREN
ncbi:PKS-NRPS hybrid synthetase cheA-like [Diospyros lotus]|uniref:PKS-NRPS hybrid synthetase cheA-like n=1 Tax=Diospyros lotus TaxID=55363 RepID=UPI002250FE26|nr:PKS-NRPS hybrid synthetase cheA-like [Diospyros lotus]